MIFTEIFESTRTAFEQIFASKMRSFLSALGVVIGISVVIIMGWLIMALDDVVESTFNMMGTDMLYVSRWDWSGGQSWEDQRNRKQISLELAQQFKELMTSAELVSISSSSWRNNGIKYKNDFYEGISIEGYDYNGQFVSGREVVEGRYFSQLELKLGSQVVLLGSKPAEIIFPNGNALGKKITIMGRHFIIIGILKKQGTAMMDFIDNKISIPLKSFIKLYGKNSDFEIGVKVGEIENIDKVRFETEGLMRSLRNIRTGQKNDFSINESKVFEEQTKVIRASVYGVGIGMTMLSFIVGIIGIINIMFVSVTERTKEIGIRKAIGAKSRSILFQFIIEAAVLCFAGAMVSFVFCSIFIFAVATMLPKFVPSVTFLTPYLPLNLLVITSIISLLVGVIAGLVPAMRAANLPPIEALMWE
jgi:putative ABC transport system permease protein